MLTSNNTAMVNKDPTENLMCGRLSLQKPRTVQRSQLPRASWQMEELYPTLLQSNLLFHQELTAACGPEAEHWSSPVFFTPL